MVSLILLAVTSLLLALFVTPPVRNLAERLGWMDQPDNRRHLHGKAVPRVGGISVAISFSGAVVLLTLLPRSLFVGESLHPLLLLIGPAMAIVFVTGLLDDIYTLGPRKKLAGQGLAAVLAWWAGLRIETLGSVALDEWQSFFLTVFWLIGCSNAFNLIDGLDGLATGTGAIAAASMVAAAFLQGNLVLALGAAPLMGALIGFLRYNFSPASIFLGDCGSLSVGFLLGSFAVLWSQQADGLLTLVAPLMALVLPLADAGIAVVRRLVRGESIFSGDRNHIHHRLLCLGLAPRKTVLVLYGTAACAAVLAVVQSAGDGRQRGLAICSFSLAAWTGIRGLRYAEFTVLRRLVFGWRAAFRILWPIFSLDLPDSPEGKLIPQGSSRSDAWAAPELNGANPPQESLHLQHKLPLLHPGPAAFDAGMQAKVPGYGLGGVERTLKFLHPVGLIEAQSAARPERPVS